MHELRGNDPHGDWLRRPDMYGPGYGDEGEVARILRAYGCIASTQAETRAMVGVLDRMGAFAASERAALDRAGFFDE